jgi:DNA-directed RNA polymerase specialized sigma24 family protein
VTAEVEDAHGWAVDRQVVLSALRTLPIEHRQVLLECHFRGASVAQAAETLGVSADTIKSRTHYALRNLRVAINAITADFRRRDSVLPTRKADECGSIRSSAAENGTRRR